MRVTQTSTNQTSAALAFVASPTADAQEACRALEARYQGVPADEADIVVALGGDGFMLRTVKQFMNSGKPIYGMNRGSVGFLMNEFRVEGLVERLANAETTAIHPLMMDCLDTDDARHTAQAINEVSLLRQTYQAAKLRVLIDDKERLDELICDGILVASPAGSTAYNLSAHGPIIPINAPLLALTPISAFRPRRWRGALLPNRAHVRIEVIDPKERPVSAAADQIEIRHVKTVSIREDETSQALLMFDSEHSWDERILNEQFRY